MMRVLTVQQPWASLIVDGFKTIENRKWTTKYRGDVAIHAGKKSDTAQRARQFHAQFGGFGLVDDLPRGVILGVVELIDVVDVHPSIFFTGPRGLVMRNPRALPDPVLYRGNLGLMQLDETIEAQVRGQL